MTNNSCNISIENLVVQYGSRVILKDLNVCFSAEKITVMLGESGCGKTTLLRVLLGLLQATSGKIFFDGIDIFTLSSKELKKLRRRFGVLFQDGALLGSLTLAENVALPLTEHTNISRSKLLKAATNALELVGLAGSEHLYPSEISGGMRKRAGLARAIISEPPVLLCDEPTSGLDPITAAQMDQLILDMKAYYPSMTTIIVSHDLKSMERIADDVLLIRNGQALFQGPQAELYKVNDQYIRDYLDPEPNFNKRMSKPPIDQEIRDALKNN